MNRKNTKIWRRWLVGILLILGLAGMGLYFLLQTETGCRFLANQVSARLSDGPYRVQLAGLRIVLPDRITAGNIAVSDATGVWLRLQGVDFRANLRRLVSGFIDVQELQVSLLELDRLPVSEPKPTGRSAPSVPSFNVKLLAGDEIRLGANVCGIPVAVSGFQGSVQGGDEAGGVRLGCQADAEYVKVGTVGVDRVAVQGELIFGAARWGVPRCEVRCDGVSMAGGFEFADGGGWPTGRMKIEVAGPVDWVQGLWPGVAFNAAVLQLECKPSSNAFEVVNFRLETKDLRVDEYTVQQAAVDGQIQRASCPSNLAVEASARVQGATVGALSITGMNFRVKGTSSRLAIEGSAGGVWQQPFLVDGAGQLQWGAGRWDIALQRASLGWFGVNAYLDEPSRILIEGGQIGVCGAFHVEPYALSAISNAVVGQLDGRVSTQVRVRGSLAAPEFEGGAFWKGVTSSAYQFPGIQGLDGRCQFGYSNGVLNVEGDAAMATGHFARLKAYIPAMISFAPWGLTFDAERVSLDVQGKMGHFQAGSLDIVGGEIDVSGLLHAPNLAAKVKGTVAGQTLDVDMGGRLRWSDSMVDLELKRASVLFAGLQAKAVEPVRVQVGGGTNVLSAAWRADVSDLTSVSVVSTQMVKGRLVADVRVRGSLAVPEIEGKIVCDGLEAPWTGLSSLSAVSGEGRFSLSNGLVAAWMSMGFATGGVVKAAVQAPVQLSFWPWIMRVNRYQSLMASVEAGLDLSILKGLDVFANGRIGGTIDLKVAHLGSLDSGSVTGRCVLTKGEYENFEYGTIIRGASINLVSQNDVLKVESGTASTGGKGRLSMTGTIQLDPSKGLPYDLEVTCNKARILHRPDADATVSGVVGIEGTLSSLRATGKLKLDEALVQLQNLRPTPPEALGGTATVRPMETVAGKANTNVVLSLAVDIPGTLYVRGRTLDSVWAGNMKFDYAGGGSGLSGYLEPRRGTLLLLKRPFKLSEGRIDFNKEWPPDPSLRLTATYSRPDLQAKVNIVGKTGNPEITLTSEPALPEDEILSRILFGKDMSTVTPLQAISLASEASKLKKIGGGTGVMGDVQEAVGIDRVEFREAGEGSGAPEVAAGKYLGDRSYVEMRRTTATAQPGKAQIYMEHELRPNIVLEAESGVEMRSGIGMFWKLDY